MADQHMIKRPAWLVFNKMQIEVARGHHFPYQISKDSTTMAQKKMQ